jgi:hypothetical protein
VPSIIRSIILLVIAVVVLSFIGKGIMHLFGGGGARTSVSFSVEDHGTVNVALDGGLMQRADGSLKLYPGDKLSAAADGNARLTFFDGSQIRSDHQTDLAIVDSTTGKDTSTWTVSLTRGDAWVTTPSTSSSGTVIRTITTPMFSVTLPTSTQAFIDASDLAVYSADGNGVTVMLNGNKQPVYIGEGQQLSLPPNPSGDPYQYRTAIDPLAAVRPFVRESRAMTSASSAAVTGTGTAIDPSALTVTSPADHAAISGDTVTVSGSVGSKVALVRINDYPANLDLTKGSFSQELAMSSTSPMTIQIVALDSNGDTVNAVTRTVTRASTTLTPPTITAPVGNGQTYRTQATQLDISGTAPSTVAGIMVNDYKLQLFRPGDTTWSYLASYALQNLHDGANVFSVYTLDANGNQSVPATITIKEEPGTVGLVSTGSTAPTGTAVDEKTLPQNAPTTPGVITVTGPQAGNQYIDNGSGSVLLEGTTSKATASIWVNGYKLQLFKPGKTIWNYIARVSFGTLKPGPNKFVINARDANNQILDTFTYTVIYNP